jgi:hypothetical protein
MKVLFLDGWTRGLHNFIPVARGLEAQGIECLLVHRGSWGNDPGRAKEERLNGLLCRDISYYRTRLIHKVLERESPNVVLLLTTNFFSDRSAILAARALGILSCFVTVRPRTS